MRLKGPSVRPGRLRRLPWTRSCVICLHLSAASARLSSEEALNKFSLTGTLRNVPSQAVAWAGEERPTWGTEASSSQPLLHLARPLRSKTPWGQKLKQDSWPAAVTRLRCHLKQGSLQAETSSPGEGGRQAPRSSVV